MTIVELSRRGYSATQIAEALGVTEGAVRYHQRRQAEEAVDGRSKQKHLAASCADAIEAWRESRPAGSGLNLTALHEHLVKEHRYQGSLRSVQRYYRATYPAPARRARRRVETPPGGQTQVDWAHFPHLIVGGVRRCLFAFVAKLSYSRFSAVAFSPSKDQLSWHQVHNECFRRLGGVSAVVRVDNEKTAVVRGAGAWGVINASYCSYARAVGFHIDACAPREPQAKGKVEREVRSLRARLQTESWSSLEELQEAADEHCLTSARRRTCPATGTSVETAWAEERRFLQPLPILPEPFDVAVMRKVSLDCLVSFEGRRYSVPFRFVGERVEVRGCAHTVQVLAEGSVVIEHPRGTEERLVIDPSCYEGHSTQRVEAPPPLGKMGRRLQEIWEMSPETRPIDLYADVAEVAR